MRVRFGCEGCGNTLELPLPEAEGRLGCTGCGREKDAAGAGEIAPGGVAERCALCPGDELYLQRDFPRRAGLATMALGAVTFLVLAGTGRPLLGFGVLGAVAALDLLLYMLLPVVTVCYRCGAELRGVPPNPAHAGFDHHLAEESEKRAAVDRANRGDGPAPASRPGIRPAHG